MSVYVSVFSTKSASAVQPRMDECRVVPIRGRHPSTDCDYL